MLVIPAIVTAWYVRSMLKKKPAEYGAPGKERLLGRLMQSSRGMFLERLGKSLMPQLLILAVDIYMIARGIYTFPSHPRFSLAIIAFNTIFFCVLVPLIFISRLIGILEMSTIQIDRIIDILLYTFSVAESSRKYLDQTAPSHDKAHETMAAALKATHNTIESMISPLHDESSKVNRPPPEVENCEGDE